MLEQPKNEEFTQGTVFSCAYAENYEACKVFGMVITARCDAAQEKVPVFTYVPVVSLGDWITNDGLSIIAGRALADARNTLSETLKKNFGLSDSLLNTHKLNDIYNTHIKLHLTDKGKKSACEKFSTLIKNHDDAVKMEGGSRSTDESMDYLRGQSRLVDSVIKELAGGRLSGYYLIRGLDSWDDSLGTDFVVLLREVHHIPTDIAKRISRGIAAADWNSSAEGRDAGRRCPKFFDANDYALPLGKLRSPWIEHLMQNFSMLFARIGVADIDHKDVRKTLNNIGLGAE